MKQKLFTLIIVCFFGFLSMEGHAQCDSPSIVWDEDGIILNWIAKPGATSHIVRYRETGTFTWTEVNLESNTFLDISFLETCKLYDFRVRTICGDLQSSFTPLYTTAVNCGTCYSEYCEIPELNDGFTNIDLVKFNDFENKSNASGSGYEDFRGSNITFFPGGNVDVTISVNDDGYSYDNSVVVFVDLNRNKLFEDDELVVKGTLDSDNDFKSSFTVPNDANLGITRIRVIITAFSYGEQNACSSNFDAFWGEVEEYCVRIGEEPSLCDKEFNTVLLGVSTGVATFKWDELEEATAYNFRYKKVNEGPEDWNELSTVETEQKLEDLEDCQVYEFELRGVCPFDTSSYKNRIVFNSFCATSTNEQDLFISSISTYPNPWSTSMTLEVTALVSGSISTNMVGVDGKIIRSISNQQINAGKNEIQLQHLDLLESGIYFIEVTNETGQKWMHKTLKIK